MPTIYQLSREPIEEDEILAEHNVLDSWMYESIISRAYDCNDVRSEAFADLVSLLIGREGENANLVKLTYDEAGNPVAFTVSEGFPSAYLKQPYELFKAKLDKLAAELTYEAFVAPGLGSDISALKAYVDNAYGDYICEDDDYSTLDRFIRYIEPGVKYYFGGVVFYKY